MPGPLLWGPNNTSNNLQNQALLANGNLVAWNGPKNFIGYNNFENGLTTGWSLGNVPTLLNGFPLSTSPTFGSGASGNLSIGVTTTSNISGTTSLLQISSAATVAGDFLASDPLTVQVADQGKVQSFKFYYQLAAGTANANFSGTSSNSFGIAIWDASNVQWIQPSGCFGMTQNAGVGIVTGTWQTPSNMTSFRFVIYNATATAGNVSMIYDDLYCGPQITAIGCPATDWSTPSTNTVTATTTAPTKGTTTVDKYYWRRVGGNLEGRIELTMGAGSAGSGDYLWLAIPSGLAIDLTKVTAYTTVAGSAGSAIPDIVGTAMGGTAGTSAGIGSVVVYDSTRVRFFLTNATSGSWASTGAAWYQFSSVTNIAAYFSVPISGWSSNTQISSDTDTRVLCSSAYVSANFSNSQTIPINFDTVEFDVNGAITTSATAWKYTAQISGIYVVSGYIGNISGTANLYIYKNGVAYKCIGQQGTGGVSTGYAVSIKLNAGDYFDIRINVGGSNTISGGTLASGNASNINVFRLSGPSVIAATDTIAMKYVNTAGTSIANTGDNNVPFATKVYDTTNSWNGTQFVVPVSGTYSVKGVINYSSQTYGVNNQLICSVYKNGALDTYGDIAPVMAIVTLPFGSVVDTSVKCNAGDTLEIRAQNTRTAGATTLNTGTGFNHVEISRSGN